MTLAAALLAQTLVLLALGCLQRGFNLVLDTLRADAESFTDEDDDTDVDCARCGMEVEDCDCAPCESCGERSDGVTDDDVPLCAACADFETPLEGRAP